VLTPIRAITAICALAVVCPPTATAQVGHPPQSSPYHDLAKGSSFTFFGGRLLGNGGRVGVGPNSGYTYGVRFDLRAARALSLGLGVERGNLERLIIDPTKAVDERVSGPVDQNVTFVGALVTLNLTGGKTWHGFAPFVGLVGGAAFAERTEADTSGYNFGTKGFFAPATGFRLFLGDRLHVRGEVRGNFWRLSYPTSFRSGTTPVTLDAKEWNLSPWFVVGLGFIL
jgi:hypothetical protein